MALLLAGACSGDETTNPAPTPTSDATPIPGAEPSSNNTVTAFIPTEFISAIDYVPNPSSPLTGWLTVTTTQPTEVSGTLGAGGHLLELAPSPPGTDHRFAIIGLHADERYRLAVSSGGANAENLATAVIDTAPLPDDFPAISATGQPADSGWTVFTANGANQTNYLVALDGSGTVAWYHRVEGGRLAAVYPTPFGLRYLVEPHVGRDIDLMGTTLREWRSTTSPPADPDADYPVITVDTNGFSQSLIELPNGMLATVSAFETNATFAESPCADGSLANSSVAITTDRVITFNPDDGAIGFQWSAVNAFTPTETPGWLLCTARSLFSRIPDAREWSGAGPLGYDDETSSLLVPFRFLDTVVSLQAEQTLLGEAGTLFWQFGKGQALNTASALDGFSAPSSVLPTNDGIIVYDAGTDRQGSFSRSIQYRFDLENNGATRVWEYRRPDSGGSGRTESEFGSIDQLDASTYLIVDGSQRPQPRSGLDPFERRASFVEVSSDGVIALEVEVGSPGTTWTIADALRIPAPTTATGSSQAEVAQS